MATRIHTLSKSDFKLARSCPTKLYYRELGYPDNVADDDYLQMLAEGGYMVEVLAKQQFPEGISLDYGGDPRDAAARTMQLLAGGEVTLFEATLLHGRRQARVDILRRTARGFDLFEVKSISYDPEDAEKRVAKTGSPFRSLHKPFGIAADWTEYLEDITFQVALLKDVFPEVPTRAHLILMDGGKVAAHDGMPAWFRIVRRDDGRLHTAEFVGDPELVRREPLTIAIEVTVEVAELEASVRAAAANLETSLHPTLKRMPHPLGGHCRDCEFRVGDVERNGFLECWGDRGRVKPHVLDLYQGRQFRDELLSEGIDRVSDIPDDRFVGRTGAYVKRQRVQVEWTRKGKEWVGEGLAPSMATAQWPLHFIDFEAARIAVPHHKGMHPYGQLAFQWSCHRQAAPGEPIEHREFLDREPTWPNERFARSLRDAIGDQGTVLVWSAFEKSVLSSIADELGALGSGNAKLAEWLRHVALDPGTIGARQLDMLKLCREQYFHPGMGGSNSIKAVLDAVWQTSPAMRERFTEFTGCNADPALGPYASLPTTLIVGSEESVTEGTGAMRAYFAMVYGVESDDPFASDKWAELLRKYCRLDTLAMVLIWEHWERAVRRVAH